MESFFSAFVSSGTDTSLSIWGAIGYALVACVLGIIISVTYMRTGVTSKNFARTLIVLPVLVCVVMLAVNGNLGTGLGVVGAFSLVRFRSLQGSSRDIGFVFFAMAIGIVCAIGELLLAGIFTVLICVIHIILSVCKFAEADSNEKDLRITIPENLDYSEIFDDLFAKYTKTHLLLSVRTTNMGSMYEIEYRIKLKNDLEDKKLLDDIRMRNGNLTVICGRCDMSDVGQL